MNCNEEVVMVTGAAGGIGRAIVKAYASAGAKVVMADIDEEKGLHVEQNFRNEGLDVYFYRVDLRYSRQIEEMFRTVIERYGKIDVLINNAGISRSRPFYQLTAEEWDDIINVNLRSIFIASREFARHMRNKGGGSIINIASTRYLMSEPHWEAYAASKGGIVSLTHALAVTLSRDRIRVNCISPGWIETGDYSGLRAVDHQQHPSMRVGKPEDVARACLFLSDRANDFINGHNLIIDGGMTKKMIYAD